MDVAWKQWHEFICIFIGLSRKKSTPELTLLGQRYIYEDSLIIRFLWGVQVKEICRLLGTRLGCPYLVKRLEIALCFVFSVLIVEFADREGLSDAWNH